VKAAQIKKHVADLAAMGAQDRFLAAGGNCVRDVRRKEPPQLTQPVDLRDLLVDAVLELRIPRLKFGGLLPDLVLERLDT
jgi:hypothetical protein